MASNAQNILNTNSVVQLPQKKELAFENKYIRLKDFYNFIKSSGNNGENVPTPFWYFCPYFYPNNESVDTSPSTNYSSLLQDSFFSKNSSMLEKLRYCIQQISFPDIGMKAMSNSGGMSGQGNLELSTIYGGFTGLQNSFLFAKNTSINISILNTNTPLVEKLIYPWMNEVVRTTKESRAGAFS